MLFIGYRSAFNIIVPSKLITKLRTLGLNTSLCNWILDLLTGRPPGGRVGNNTSTTLILNTGAPQGCVLSPLLYSLFTHDCMARQDSNTIIKFADETTVVGLITDNDETAYKEEVRDLVVWCQDNNLSLNVIKTKEKIVDYRKRRTEHDPILIAGAAVEQDESFKFLGVHITNKLSWSKHTKTVVKRARQNPIPPQETEMIRHGSSDPQKVLQLHHREHLDWLHHCLVWQLRTAQYITGAKLPAIQDLYTNCLSLQPP